MTKLVASVIAVSGNFQDNIRKVWEASDDNQQNFMNPTWEGLEVRFLGEDEDQKETHLMIVGEVESSNILSKLPCHVKEATPFMALGKLLNHERNSKIGTILDHNHMVISAYNDEYGEESSAFTDRDVEYASSRQMSIDSKLALLDVTAKAFVSESCEYESTLSPLDAMHYPSNHPKRDYLVSLNLFKDEERIYLALPNKVGVDIMYDAYNREVVRIAYTGNMEDSKINISYSGHFPNVTSCICDIVNYLNAFPEDQCSLYTSSKGKAVDFNLIKLT